MTNDSKGEEESHLLFQTQHQKNYTSKKEAKREDPILTLDLATGKVNI